MFSDLLKDNTKLRAKWVVLRGLEFGIWGELEFYPEILIDKLRSYVRDYMMEEMNQYSSYSKSDSNYGQQNHLGYLGCNILIDRYLGDLSMRPRLHHPGCSYRTFGWPVRRHNCTRG
ncbi:MAG TPA: hypothetical protein DD473_12600 [Planctomycetaceae bacterium]|nr:hypothetical protein [Planctomycetaceae bacterium]